jgi:hypothetical protein
MALIALGAGHHSRRIGAVLIVREGWKAMKGSLLRNGLSI